MWLIDLFKKNNFDGWWMNILWSLFNKDNLISSNKETKEALKNNAEERHSFLGEIFESFIARKFPTISRMLDLASITGLKNKDPEAHALQSEFETLTAISTFVPNSLLRKFTDPLVNQSWFKTVVDWYPLDGSIEKKILEEKNPQAVIDFIRMLHQDVVSFMAGKSSLFSWWSKRA